MRILCSISGIEFQCDHLPLTLHARESYHPVFNVPQRKLLPLLNKWSANELTKIDSYLLFLALLRSSDLVEFRTSARITNLTDSIVAKNMEHLAKTLGRLNTVLNPAVVFPHYVVSHETCDLSNVSFWIENWKESHAEFLAGYKSPHDLSKVNKREATLERLIKNPHKKVSEFAPMLAEWAATAGNFPTFIIEHPFTHLPVPCAEYWKMILIRCANEESLFSIPQTDIQELLTHCEDEIPDTGKHGTIHSYHVFKILRHAIERQKNFLGLGDLDVGSHTRYSILSDESGVGEANLESLRASAPDHEPKRSEYPNTFAYMKAKMRWTLAEKERIRISREQNNRKDD